MSAPHPTISRHLVAAWTASAALVLGATVAAIGPAPDPPRRATVALRVGAAAPPPPSCPWVEDSRLHRRRPASLAAQVVARMTLQDKAGFVVLRAVGGTENINTGVASLCIPPLTLSDGPNGIAYNATGVTQLPAAIGVAASFDPDLARATGGVLGEEGRAKGIDLVQGPELNLARVPQSGRIFETFGEDPYLTSVLGVANMEGIQATGVMADAKHFTGYTQETSRVRLDQRITARALAELYDAPFAAAVEQAHVASVMCSYGSLNGINDCSSPTVYRTLRAWGFAGFVRSDLRAIADPGPAFAAGLALIKPATPGALIDLVRSGALPVATLDSAVKATLTEMFDYGLIAHPRRGTGAAVAITPAHTAIALSTAERSMVLLKNVGHVLPLPVSGTAVAVIGTDASELTHSSGDGSSVVTAAFSTTPLAAIRRTLDAQTRLVYAPGGPTTVDLDPLSDADLISGSPLAAEAPIRPSGEPGKSDVPVIEAPNVTAALATASRPGTGEGWTHWQAVYKAPTTGTYELSLQQIGDTWLYVDGRAVFASRGLHSRSTWSTAVPLRGGARYHLAVTWFAVAHKPPPKLGIVDDSPRIAAAVAAARSAPVAVVFVGDLNAEGVDRPGLALSGDADALIAAVAAVNPRTIVVLNTGGAVLMPWLHQVAAVVEAWYPGEVNGTAISAVLFGRVDPSGHLPITFPSSGSGQPLTSTRQFPGVDAVVHYDEGLDIGYRWYQAHHVVPLFPFGYGLTYTSFQLSHPSVRTVGDTAMVNVTVTNTGATAGADVIQAYVRYPAVAGEPPEQLRAFARVDLAPSASAVVRLPLAASAFATYVNGAFRTPGGSYGVDVGESSANLPVHLTVTKP